MIIKDSITNPFNIICKNKYEETNAFTYNRLINYGSAYYYIKDTSFDYISKSVVSKCDGVDNEEFKSRFYHYGETEKFCIEELEVTSTFENKGVMTIMFCDVMLAMLTRELSHQHHIEVKFINTSDLIKDGKIVNVYHSVVPNYELSTTKPDSTRISLEGQRNKSSIEFYQDIYNIFPLETREEDIEYYTNLRAEKIKSFNKKLKAI